MESTLYVAFCLFVYSVYGLGRHSGYSREIRHRAWQIKTGSWFYEMH